MVDKVQFYILFLHENSFRSTFMIIICILKSTITIIMSLLLFKKKKITSIVNWIFKSIIIMITSR